MNEYIEPTKHELMINAEQHLGKDLLSFIIQELKAAPKPWEKMSENEQQDVIFRATKRIKDAVRQAVTIIAAKDRPSMEAHVKKVVFSDGGVEGVVVLSKKQGGRHDFADSQGENITIVITNPSEYTESMTEVEADKDQKEIF